MTARQDAVSVAKRSMSDINNSHTLSLLSLDENHFNLYLNRTNTNYHLLI